MSRPRKTAVLWVVAVALIALGGGLATVFAAAGGLVCHVTGEPAGEEGRCVAIVLAVSPASEAGHLGHGDVPAPAGASPGDRFTANCR